MAAGTPLNRLTLAAGSVADDLGFAALADLARALEGVTDDYRIIGGHMVTMLAARWQLGAELYRETGDVDLGVPPVVARNCEIAGRLKAINYRQVAGNRFARSLSDVPAGLSDEADSPLPEAVIDVLVPAYTGRAKENVMVSEDLFTTEVPGLHVALSRSPVELKLELRRLNSDAQHADLLFPDEVSAIVLKSLATQVRHKDTDIADIWRCLEIAFAARVTSPDFARGTKAEGAARIRGLFSSRHSPGMRALATGLRLPAQAADERYTRVRALINQFSDLLDELESVDKTALRVSPTPWMTHVTPSTRTSQVSQSALTPPP
jgi:hypothetical protein